MSESRNEMSKSRTSFVRLFLGVFLSATGSCCPIELSHTSVVVRYGDPVSVNCSTSETTHAGMGWEVPFGGSSLEKVDHVLWTVDNLEEWSITSLCFITPGENSTFEQCQEEVKVVLYTFPETIRITPNDTMNEGKEHNLTCHIGKVAPVQNLTVMWYKGDTIFHTQTFDNTSKEPVDQSPVLSFTPTEQDDGVKFRCEAHLDLGPEGPQLNVSSQELTAVVWFGPVVQCSSVEVPEGETLRDRCTVKGNPKPSIQWLKDGKPVDPDQKMTREKAGLYIISQKSIQVYVTYGPELTCPSNYTALENAPHNLTCTVEGYPEPKMIWYRDGDEVELPENLTRIHAGQYLVSAWNRYSSINCTVELDIIYPPSPIDELEDSVVEVGSDVRLKCSSIGNPRPVYSWFYHSASNVMEENDDGVSRLIIINATADNMGSYRCQAMNEKGNVFKTVNVTVKGVKQPCHIKMTPDSKIPENVSIRHVNKSSLVEEEECQLQCNISNVAPARRLIVRLYHGNETIETVTGCQPENNINCNESRTPMNVSISFSVTLKRKYNKAEFSCEAELDLKPEGPQVPYVKSKPLNITVYYKPVINNTKLPKAIPVFSGYPEQLICEADGYPPPKIQWLFSPAMLLRVSEGLLNVSQPGLYFCNATNEVGSASYKVQVILKEDYLPLIAGFVAVTVVVISVIFLFIYSIYYKNTKMRRYSVKNPKFSNHNGNVAHNGWDLQFPMTKLS